MVLNLQLCPQKKISKRSIIEKFYILIIRMTRVLSL